MNIVNTEFLSNREQFLSLVVEKLGRRPSTLRRNWISSKEAKMGRSLILRQVFCSSFTIPEARPAAE